MNEPLPRSSKESKFGLGIPQHLGWLLGLGLSLMLGLGLVLFFLLMQATNNQALYENYYTSILLLNLGVAVLLLLGILWLAHRLYRRFQQGKFGSRLLLKLAAVFALAGFVPGVLIYGVSYQFVARSIESWFDIKVEGALEAGLNLGRTTLETLSSDVGNKTRAASQTLQEASDMTAALSLERIREQLDARDVVLWGSNGNLLAIAGPSQLQLSPQRPTPQQFRQAKFQTVTWTEGLEEALEVQSEVLIKSLTFVPASTFKITNEGRYLMVVARVPANLVVNAALVNEAYREYQERALAREGLKRMYIGTLTLSLFLAVMGAVLLAAVLGNQITRPLLLLAEGVRQVASGDLTPKTVTQSQDELGGLTRSFADMTQQLSDARQAIQNSMSQVSDARARLQTILDNLTAGVLVLSPKGEVQTANPGALRILNLSLSQLEGHQLVNVTRISGWAVQVERLYKGLVEDPSVSNGDHWQHSFEIGSTSGQMISTSVPSMTLVARGALLPNKDWLLVFDDISEIVSAQRTQAWGEVARRLAHEIKNPLTPIQLSAERLEKKLSGKLDDSDHAVMTKSVKTIVDQVEAMKRMVNEFRDFGRLPPAELQTLDLNELVAEVLQLYGGEDTPAIGIHQDLELSCPAIQGDPQQLRQVLHNLLQNAQDASALVYPLDSETSLVTVMTRWLKDQNKVVLKVQDSGSGFPEAILKRAFEPYVTTKSKGTGLGLAVVKKIAEEHAARIHISNREAEGKVFGAEVSLSFDVHHPK